MSPGTPPRTSAAEPARWLFVFDVDGTLLNARLQVAPSTRQAVRALLAGGHRVALASARPPRSIALLSRDLLGAVAEMIALNGAWVSEGDEALLERTLAPDDVAAIVAYARAQELEINLFSGWEWWVEAVGPGIEAEAVIVSFAPTVVDDLLVPARRATHKILLIGDPGRVRDVRDWAEEHVPNVAASRSKPDYCELVARDASKADAMTFLASRLGIPPGRVVAFGDGENDLPMIERAGIGVAMGNAMGDVKKAADLTTKSHDQDGIAHALRTLGFLPRDTR